MSNYHKLIIETIDHEKLSAIVYPSQQWINKKEPSLTILTMEPYRLQTYNINSTDYWGSFLQQQGYNYVALDIRGTGQSTGIPVDEYSREEMDDTLTVISTIIKQPWSNAKIIMWGISYSGFTALQTCLSASMYKLDDIIVSAFVMHATDDRWKTDIHWWGGVKTVTDWLQYATSMTSFNLAPQLKKDGSLSLCNNKDRINEKPWVMNWLTKNKSYWKQGSIASQACHIKIPILLFGGFHDLYLDAMVRLHHLLPNNITIISQKGHDYPTNHNELFLWWLKNYHTIKGKTIYYKPFEYSWIKIINDKKNTIFNWDKGGIIPLKFICGPLFRYRSQSPCLSVKEQLDAHALHFPFEIIYKKNMAYIDTPLIEFTVRDPPSDFYIVAWILDEKGYLYSMGVQRYINCQSIHKLKMSPLCIPRSTKKTFGLYMSISNVPTLIPQFWLKEPIHILQCKMTLMTSNYENVKNNELFPEGSTELYVDDNLTKGIIFEPNKSLLFLSTLQKECPMVKTKHKLPPNADYECEDERFNILIDNDYLHATFHDDMELYDKYNNSIIIHTITQLFAVDKMGTLLVDSYQAKSKNINDIKLISSWVREFSL